RHRRARQRADGAARRRRADRQLHPPGRGAAMVTSRLLLPSLLATALAACTVGPDFVRPEVAVPESFIQAPTTAAGSETGVVPEADAAFWQRFGDPQLTALVEQALAANHDLRIALASYDRANALLRGAKFDYLPTITAGAEASDGRASSDQLPGVDRDGRDAESYSAGIQASWELDLFGRIRSEEHTSELQSR